MMKYDLVSECSTDRIRCGIMQDAYGGDEFDEEDLSEVGTPSSSGKFVRGRSYAEGRKKHNTG